MPTRIELPSLDELPKDIGDLLKLLPPLNAFRMMALVTNSFKGFLDLAGSVLSGADFDARLREIAVLRVVRVMNCKYAWSHHVTVGKMTGLTEEDIRAIRDENPVRSLDEEGNLLCRVADEITTGVRLGDESLIAVKNRYGNSGAAALILCCSYFNMLGRCLESMRVPLETEDVDSAIKLTFEKPKP
jgi:hypothetical protein